MNLSPLLVSRIGGGAVALAFATIGCSSAASSAPDPSATWPKQVTLHRTAGGGTEGEAMRLSDGALVAAPGDLRFGVAMMMSLFSSDPADLTFCAKGKFGSLAEIPLDESTCPGSYGTMWLRVLFLDGSSVHTKAESYSINVTALVRSPSDHVLYRMRILGDAHDAEGNASVEFEYEPVP
jgi:hypothetical protein